MKAGGKTLNQEIIKNITKSSMGNKKILLGLTTTWGSDWREKIEEIEKFNIREIALFLTAIKLEDRKELYSLLEKTKLEVIPHVHLKDDMNLWELEYLEKRFHVQVFNIHGEKDPHPFLNFKDYLGAYCSKTYIENTEDVPSKERLNDFGGICVDFSHWQDGILFDSLDYDKKMKAAIKKFNIGCSHISAVGNKLIRDTDIQFKDIIYKNFSKHHLDDLSELDYIKKYIEFIPDIVSIELNNSFEEQLKVKEYLEKIINNSV
jgi:hypothetical protein